MLSLVSPQESGEADPSRMKRVLPRTKTVSKIDQPGAWTRSQTKSSANSRQFYIRDSRYCVVTWAYIFLAQSLTPVYSAPARLEFCSWNLVLIKSRGCMIITSIHPDKIHRSISFIYSTGCPKKNCGRYELLMFDFGTIVSLIVTPL